MPRNDTGSNLAVEDWNGRPLSIQKKAEELPYWGWFRGWWMDDLQYQAAFWYVIRRARRLAVASNMYHVSM